MQVQADQMSKDAPNRSKHNPSQSSISGDLKQSQRPTTGKQSEPETVTVPAAQAKQWTDHAIVHELRDKIWSMVRAYHPKHVACKPPLPGKLCGAASDATETELYRDMLQHTFGTSDADVQGKLVEQVLCAKPSGAGATFQTGRSALGALHGMHPADTIDGFAAVQILAAHDLAMNFSAQAMKPKLPPAAAAVYSNLAAKSSRLFVELVDLLDRRHGNGRQQSNVEHVHLHERSPESAGTVYHAGQTAKEGHGKAKASCKS